MTTYEEIYNRFLQKITDWKIIEISESDMTSMMHGWLTSTVAKQKKISNDLVMDDENECFTVALSLIEIEILSLGMVIEWLTPQVYSVINIAQIFGGKEEKFYSQSNHLSELQAMLKQAKIEKKKLLRDYSYQKL